MSYLSIRAIFFSFSLALVTLPAFAQDKIDSLTHALSQSKQDTLTHSILIKLGNAYINSSSTKADSIFNESFLVAKKLNNSKLKAVSRYRSGWNKLAHNKFKEALPLILESVKLTDNDTLGQTAQHAGYNMTAGWLYDKIGDYYSALKHYNISEAIFTKQDKRNNVANVLINKGIIHDRLDNKEKALELYQKCKEEYEAANDSVGLIYAFNNIGHITYKNGKFDKAIDVYNKGLEIAFAKSDTTMITTLFQNVGKAHSDNGNLIRAIENYKKSVELNTSDGDNRGKAYAEVELEELYLRKDKKPIDLKIIRSAYDLAELNGDIDLEKRACEILFSAYKSRLNYKDALKYRERLDILKDSISSDALRLKIENLELSKQFENEKFQNKLEQQKLESDYSIQLKEKNYFRNLLLTILGLTLLFIFFIYKNYRNLLKTSLDLESKNTALLEAERNLAKKNEDLERYIDLNIELEQFAHIVSHDIKSPLRTISSYIGLLKKKLETKVGNEEMGHLNIVENNSKRLNDLVNDLLLYTKANADNLNLSRFNLQDLINEVLNDIEFRVSQSECEIEKLGLDSVITADRIKLKLILQNLIDNAIKFSADKSPPKVRIAFKEDESFFDISVSDNGIGIPLQFKNEVFDKFIQLNPKDKYEGTGLGLSIVKNYVEKHHGIISISDGIESGTKISFTISKELKETY